VQGTHRTENGCHAGTLPSHPSFRGPVNFTYIDRPKPSTDETDTAQTIEHMRRLAIEDSRSPIVRRALMAALATRPSDDVAGDISAIHSWIHKRVRFVEDSVLAAGAGDPDPDQAEVLVRPVDLLTMPHPEGDCDDFSMLAASMMYARGIPFAGYKTIAGEPGDPNYSHVYGVAGTPNGLMALDASHGPIAGWEAKAAGKSRVWPLEQGMAKHLGRLGFEDGYTPPEIDGTDGNSPIWGSINSAINTAGTIFTRRYGRPDLQPGEYAQTQYGNFSRGGAPLTAGGGGGGMLLIGIVVVALLLLIVKSASK
jgi:hypothetical protein